jgi:Carboxypeptidase regulatory-like domain
MLLAGLDYLEAQMKTFIAFAVLLLALAAQAQGPLGGGSDSERSSVQVAATRSLTGQVKDASEAPLPNAVVYLKNTKTLAVKTFITDNSGEYRFHALSPNVDYEVFAEHKGKKSDTKTLSAFDSRTDAFINLKVK